MDKVGGEQPFSLGRIEGGENIKNEADAVKAHSEGRAKIEVNSKIAMKYADALCINVPPLDMQKIKPGDVMIISYHMCSFFA